MKKLLLLMINIFFAASICLSQNLKKEDFVCSNSCGSFITLSADNKVIKEEYTLEETMQQTSDGGICTFLKVTKKAKQSVSNIDTPSHIDTVTIVSSEVIVYPNPVTNQLTVKTNLSTKEKVTFAIYDLNGNLVKKVDNVKSVDEVTIPRSDLNPGDFVYKVFNSSKVFSSGRLRVN
ncbi:MAG: T9SS type A sorting domain-containing protein [Cytophagaceae bacterium]|nr:T9SS type A sorting domain-containing protein [Cytophagaceae bacterium]